MNKRHCSGCRNDFYNGNNGHNGLGVSKCWSLKEAKLVLKLPIGNWEEPPYTGKKKVRVSDCYHTESGGTHYVDPSSINSRGYWK